MHRTALKLFAVTVSVVPNIAAADGGLGAIGGIIAVFAFSLGIAAIVPGLVLFYSAIRSLKDSSEVSAEDTQRKKIRSFIWPIILLVVGGMVMNFGFENV